MTLTILYTSNHHYHYFHCFGDVLSASTEETRPNETKANIYLEQKHTTTQNKYKKLKPGLVALYDLRPGNRLLSNTTS